MQHKLPQYWNNLFDHTEVVSFLEQTLTKYLPTCRWFGGKSRNIANIQIKKHISFDTPFKTYACILQCNYTDGLHEWYSLPLTLSSNNSLPNILAFDNTFLVDALQTDEFRKTLYLLMYNSNSNNEISAFKNSKLQLIASENLQSKILKVEQSNTSIIFNDTYFFKWFRKIDIGTNPDLETIKYLTEETEFKNIPTYVGHIQLHLNSDVALLGMMQKAVPNQGDAWVFVCNNLKNIYHSLLENPKKNILDFVSDEFYTQIKLLGKRTAQLHNALSAGNIQNGFDSEPFNIDYQLWVNDCIEKLIDSKFELLEQNLPKLTNDTKQKAHAIIASKQKLKSYFHELLSKPLIANKIRIHGDYHLGQVLYSNHDFVILDFEGEPDKPHNMRRIKYTALRDVAGMMRSFHYAAFAVLYQDVEISMQNSLASKANQWYKTISNLYLESYLQHANEIVLPQPNVLQNLLQLYITEKAIYEMGYEINNRPTWISIPLESLYELVTNIKKT